MLRQPRKVTNRLSERRGSGFSRGLCVPTLSQDRGQGQQAYFLWKFCPVTCMAGEPPTPGCSQAALPFRPFREMAFQKGQGSGALGRSLGHVPGIRTLGRLEAATWFCFSAKGAHRGT